MPGRVKKTSPAKEGEYRMRTLDVLNSVEEALTTDQIKNRDFILSSLTTQKMSRILGYLIEMGFVRKSKSKSSGRMMYKAVSKMEEQGYDIEEPAAAGTKREYHGIEWDLEDHIAETLVDEDEDHE